MKKKGLIISTVVMVVVLIASLTTATYAWFTASTKTSIDGFAVSVTSNNAVNIGFKTDYNHYVKDASSNTQPVSISQFKTGNVTFTSTTDNAGSLTAPGTWDGDEGLSANLSHNINWGSQSKAVGVTSQTASDGAITGVNDENTGYWTNWTSNSSSTGLNTSGKNTVIAANKGTAANELADVKLARANVAGTTDAPEAGDYVHFILGVMPTRNLDTNNFVIMISPTTTGSLGVLASIHVAYRITKYDATSTTDWTEVDVYGTNTANTSVNSVSGTIADSVQTAYKNTTGESTVPTGSAACVISGLDMNVNEITQLEIVIYMAGDDQDCNDQGKTAAGNVAMFFETADATTKATSATKDTSNIVKIEGGESTYTNTNTTVQYTTDNGTTWKTLAGNWKSGTFTATTAVTEIINKVKVTTIGKAAKELNCTTAG